MTNLDIVWQTVQKDLPPLIKILERSVCIQDSDEPSG